MKKLSKIGVGILLGCLLSNSITEEDFIELRDKLLKKGHEIQPKLSEYFYDLNNIVSAQDSGVDIDIKDQKILSKLREIQDEITNIKSKEMANMIVDNLKERDDNE